MTSIPTKIGDYKIIREIGRGATATVYLAENPRYPVPIALKYISFRTKNSDEARWNRRLLKLLRAEESVAQKLDHPNIIKIYEAHIGTEEAYIVMEYFPGTSLEEFCSFEKMLPVNRAVSMVFKCCMALDYAFKQGIVHRDIKPANILVDENDNIKITDFGLALNVQKKSDQDSTFIMGVGSPAYMSPEQIKGYPLNQKTDLFSLGVVLFHLLAGRLPFRAKHPAQLVYKIINADPPDVSLLNPDVPAQMDTVIRKALEKDLYSRYKNGADFAKDLSAVRYKILEEGYQPPDTTRFGMLRKLSFFAEFDDIEVWEILRLCAWRRADENVLLIEQDETDQRFGILIEGSAEISMNGKLIAQIGAGEPFGESAYLDTTEHKQNTRVVARSAVQFLEVAPAALELASAECMEHMRTRLATVLVQRLSQAHTQLAAYAPPAATAVSPSGITSGMGRDLKLVDN